MKIVECKGFSKEVALDSEVLGFTTEIRGANATQAWIKAGKPTVGTPGFKAFAADQLKLKTKNTAGLGVYIVLEAGVEDNRERPYKVISVKTEGARKFKRVYQVTEAVIKETPAKKNDDGEVVVPAKYEISELGAVVGKAATKGAGNDLLKEWITDQKRDYVLTIAEEVVEGQPIASYGKYTPSVSAKEGTYIAFGNVKD